MGDVLTVLKVVPSGTEVDRSDLIEKIKTEISPKNDIEILKTEEQPLVFGLYALMLTFVVPDTDKGVNDLNSFQEELERLEEIDSVSIEIQALNP